MRVVLAGATDGERQDCYDSCEATTADHLLLGERLVGEDADLGAIETPTESDGLCIYIRPFSQLFDGYGNSTANDDQNGFEFFKFRCAVIHDGERCSASRLHYNPVIGKESLACEYSGPIRDHDAAKRMLL
jgi:hypothetical protein